MLATATRGITDSDLSIDLPSPFLIRPHLGIPLRARRARHPSRRRRRLPTLYDGGALIVCAGYLLRARSRSFFTSSFSPDFLSILLRKWLQ